MIEMLPSSDWIAPWIGLIGVVIGVGMAEWFRRRQRVEQFAAQVFSKRLEVYEGLWKILRAGQSAVGYVLEDTKLSEEERKEVVGTAIMAIAQYTDDFAFFLDEEVVVHCCTVFMGAENIPSYAEPKKSERLAQYQRKWRATREIILESSGMNEINRTFGKINRPKYDSAVVDYYRKLRDQQHRDERKAG